LFPNTLNDEQTIALYYMIQFSCCCFFTQINQNLWNASQRCFICVQTLR